MQNEYFGISNCVFNFNFLAPELTAIYTYIYIFIPMQNEYFGISNCVFNFNFLALAVSEILGESQIYTRGPYAPWTPPSGEIFVPNASI